jgi:predicted outer membrane repeat protein
MKLRAWIYIVVTLGLLLGPWAGGLRPRPSVQAAPSAATWYVKPGENGACTSWTDACELQSALSKAGSGDEIWVAAGTYLPDYNPGNGTHTGDRTATFQLKNGVGIYGGFADTGDPVFDDRDWETHTTTLSGDIGTPDDDSDNSYHVVSGSGTGATALLDGFTIRDGHASGGGADAHGGGMYTSSGSSTLANVTFVDNAATGDGGGMCNDYSSPTLSNVTFSGNSAGNRGGGIYSFASYPTLNDVTLVDNSASSGGGIYDYTSVSTLNTVTFSGNSAEGTSFESGGGGMYSYDSQTTLTGVEFSGNTAGMDGGGMHIYSGSATLTNVTFDDNTAGRLGGGILNLQCDLTLSTVTFRGNTALWFGGGMFNAGSTLTLTNVTFTTNSATDGDGGGMANDDCTSALTNVTFISNTATYNGGGMVNSQSTAALTDTQFLENTATSGGGMYNHLSSSPELTNVMFITNTATANGGGMYNEDSTPALVEVTFSGNSAGYGGGMYNDTSNPMLTNVTFVENMANPYDGGGMNSDYSDPVLTNVTFSSNTATRWGGGMSNGHSNPELTNVTLSENTAGDRGGGIYSYASGPTLTDATFVDNGASYGGGMYEHTSSSTLDTVTFSGNSAGTDGGGMFTYSSSPTLTASTFISNTAAVGGGGMYNEGSSPMLIDVAFSTNNASSGGGMYNVTSTPVLTRTHLFGNTADSNGGGIYNADGSNPRLFHSLVSGNQAGDSGGGMYNDNSSPRLFLSALSANHAAVQGGGLDNVNGSGPVVVNSLIWGTAATPGAQVSSDVSSTPVISYSLVQGGYPGPGNLDADPQFADADGPDDVVGTPDDDLHLTCSSPALDGGDNSAVPAGVTTDLDGNPRFRGLGEPVVDKPPVDMGPYEEQDYGDWVSAGYTNLHEGQAYRTGFHVEPAKTIQATIDAYQEAAFLQASDLYSQALLTCAPTAERRVEAGTGLLDARWELATGGMLLGNEAMVQTLDMRYAAQSGLVDQIARLEEARENYITATVAYLEILPGDVYTVAVELQPSRNTPLDGSEAPYVDVQRLAEAAARKSRATLEIAERQFRLYTPAGKAAAEDTLRQGFDQAMVELALLGHLAEGWAEPTTAYLNAYQALTQDLADMERLFGYLQEGKNPFGYAAQYVPFMPIELGVENPDPNFVRWYDRAMTNDWVGYDKAVAEYDALMAQQRDLDDDGTALGTAMGLLDGKYRERLVEICGPDGTEPDLAGCHRNEAGTMEAQLSAIEQAEIRVQKVRLQMEDQLALIRIEQQRAAQVAGIHRATAVMYTETGEELASLARQEVELQQSSSWCDMLGGIFSGAWSGASTGMAFGPEGAIIGGALSGLLEIGSIIEAEATAPDMDLADIAARREEIKAYQQAQVEYAEADIEDANSEALIKQYMLEYAELKLDLAIAINQLQQELARLEGMKAQVEYLLARWNEARRTATELYYDPGARVVRDMYAEEARHYFEAALGSAYLAGRALDYEMAEQWPDEQDVYGLVVPEGTGNLEGHLADMWTTYQSWYEVSPQQRDTAIKLSEALGFVDSWEMVGGVPKWVMAEEKFNRYVSDPGNWVDRDHDGTAESLELVFQTTLFADPPQFFSNNVYNDKIRYFYIVLWGDESALDPDGNDTYVMLRQEGTSFIRDEDARPLEGNDSYREYNPEPTRNYAPKAIYNRKPSFDGDESYRSYGLYWRSVACTKWVLTIDREGDPANDDLDLAALDEIEVHISQRNFPLATRRAAEGEAEASSPEAGPATQSPEGDSVPVAAARDAPRVRLASLTADADAARRFAGTVIPEQPPRLPSLELALRLEETGGSVTGAIEADGLLGYPVLDTETGLGPMLHGTVQDGKYVLTSDPFASAGGTATRQLMLTTTVATSSTISGEYVETILGLIPHDLEVRGVYTLTRSLDEPLAGFSAKPSTGPVPLVVDFLDFSLGDPTGWAWDFGDGATSAEPSPTHTYEQPGLYTVTLTVSNLFGSHTHTETGYISVTEPAAPLAYFVASPRSGFAPLTVAFEDRSAGGPTSWDWDFGDEATSTDQDPVHLYDEPGSYTVTLTVTNEFGSQARTEPDYIIVAEPVPPEAHFSATPTSGIVPLTVTFTDQSTHDPTAWAWDFGDGGSSTEQHPEYIYQTAGTFAVTLTVSNAHGSDTWTMPDYITVIEGKTIYLPLVLRSAGTR